MIIALWGGVIREGFKKKLDKLGLLAEVGGGGVGGGLKGPTCYMVYSLSLEHAKKHFQTI